MPARSIRSPRARCRSPSARRPRPFPIVQDGRKIYRFTVRWGVETDSDDADGKVIATSDVRPERAAIEAALPDFTGEIMQRPPIFSALKIEGERAYDLARDGAEVVLEERPVSIHRLALAGMPDRDHAVFDAECGKGTYVRALARDIGRRLGSLGHVAALRRLAVGPFDEATIRHARRADRGARGGRASPRSTVFSSRPASGSATCRRSPSPRSTRRASRRGQSVLLRGRDAPDPEGHRPRHPPGESIAIGEIERGRVSPDDGCSSSATGIANPNRRTCSAALVATRYCLFAQIRNVISHLALRAFLWLFPPVSVIFRAPRPPGLLAHASGELQRSRDLAGRHPGCGRLTLGMTFPTRLDTKRILDVDHSRA